MFWSDPTVCTIWGLSPSGTKSRVGSRENIGGVGTPLYNLEEENQSASGHTTHRYRYHPERKKSAIGGWVGDNRILMPLLCVWRECLTCGDVSCCSMSLWKVRLPGTVLVSVNWKVSVSVVDPDPHSFFCPGSGSVLGMRIRIQEHENWSKCINFKKAFVQFLFRHLMFLYLLLL
jgi:hypothetical protein